MKYDIFMSHGLKTVIRYPNGYEEGKKYPVLFYLHGAGTLGTNINVLLNNPCFRVTEIHDDFPFIMVAPQCPASSWFDVFEKLQGVAMDVAMADYADSERIYLMGVSMGGYGTWQLAMTRPEIFAAAVPICGGGMYWCAPRLVDTPVWAFHGKLDTCVYPEESEKMVNAVNFCGGSARLTIYPECGHDAWTLTYKNREVFEWLLSHKNKNVNKLENLCKGAKEFG